MADLEELNSALRNMGLEEMSPPKSKGRKNRGCPTESKANAKSTEPQRKREQAEEAHIEEIGLKARPRRQ